MKMAAMCGLLVLSVTGFAWAQASVTVCEAVGNLPSGFYVQPSCPRPDKTAIGKQPVSTDRDDVLACNLRIRRFNKESAAFNDCIEAYAGKADHDIDRVLSIVNGSDAQGSAPPPGNMPADFYPPSPCHKPNGTCWALSRR